MPRACAYLNPSPHYGRAEFENGLSSLGYEIHANPLDHPKKGDVLVLWNRYRRHEQHAQRYERAGGTVLITENAWLGPEEKEHHWFALCRGHHNGAGTWHVGAEPRPLGAELKPWRETGEHVLVLPQRGMGEEGVRQPRDWLHSVLPRLAKATNRPIVVRHHPGQRPHPEIDFTGCWAVVCWGSGAAVKALVSGIPVFHEMPNWVGAPAATFGIDDIEKPYLGDRGPALHRLSYAQWTSSEIASGLPFVGLLTS